MPRGRGRRERERKKKHMEGVSLGEQKLLTAVFRCSDFSHGSAPLPIVPYLILGQLHPYGFQPCPVKDHPSIFFQSNFPESLEF